MLDVGLKEWASVCDLLIEGRCALLLRKGGIHETGGPGRFELEHRRFVLFPSWMHQKSEMLKPEFQARVTTTGSEPATLAFRAVGEAARIWRVPDRARFDAIDDLHPWTRAQIDMRFAYRPENPLYVVAVRAGLLNVAKSIPYRPEYAGCKSWVPLRKEDAADDVNAKPVLSDDAFDALCRRIEATL